MRLAPRWIGPDGVLLGLKPLPQLQIKLCSQYLDFSFTKDARFMASGCRSSSISWWTPLLNHAYRLERDLSHSELRKPDKESSPCWWLSSLRNTWVVPLKITIEPSQCTAAGSWADRRSEDDSALARPCIDLQNETEVYKSEPTLSLKI